MKCTFCNKEIPKGRGTMFVRKDGKVVTFCSRKCINNLKLKRSGKKLKWTSF